ncbi:MAG: MerR family transcriptional regulator [Saprospiraceae bacterium]|nr:MerR family transcriptional regulator [Saprospiraceae bacterium]
MDRKITELTKLYYTIGEVSDMFGVSKSLIRYWESEFAVLKPHKNSKGDRRFTKQNIEQLDLIYYLVKEKGFTLDGAKKEIRAKKSTLIRRRKVIDSLVHIRSGLTALRDQLT